MATLRIHELPEQERPREKLAALGAGALSDSELIAILLRTGLPGANAVDVARQLLAKYQSLSGLARCNVTEEVSHGSLNESVAHPREIFRPAITHAAYALILVHNHPSGDPTPSDADLRLTRRLNEAAELLQIRFLDHVIIGSPDNGRRPYFSFREAGVI